MRRATVLLILRVDIVKFQFTPVVRRATDGFSLALASLMFQFTPVVRRATGVARAVEALAEVSIHARRATGDPMHNSKKSLHFSFNSRPSCDGRLVHGLRTSIAVAVSIHARRATGDDTAQHWRIHHHVFQFTPVVRRATAVLSAMRSSFASFNSRPSCDGRPPKSPAITP